MRGVDTSAVVVGKWKWDAALALGGKIYGIPCNAGQLLVYDPATDAAGGVDTAAYTARHQRGLGNTYDDRRLALVHAFAGSWSAAVALGGRIYGIPFNAKRLLVCDPAWAARRLLALASRKPQREVVCVTTETGAHGDESRAIALLGPDSLSRAFFEHRRPRPAHYEGLGLWFIRGGVR